MALTKKVFISSIDIQEDGKTRITETTIISEDGEEISQLQKFSIVEPGNDLNLEDSRVKTALTGLHTAQVISDYEAAKLAQL